MRKYRRELGIQVALSGRKRLVNGGDFNTNAGKQNARRGVCGT